MLLKGRDGSEFETTVVGYEFPHIEHQEWDSNWLMIAMRVQSPLGFGTSEDPCVTTWDVSSLIAWLESQAQSAFAGASIGFLEPNLAFEVVAVSGASLTLRVRFILERRAFWKPVTGQRRRRGRWRSFVDLEVTPAEAQAAADAWRADLHKFPLREW